MTDWLPEGSPVMVIFPTNQFQESNHQYIINVIARARVISAAQKQPASFKTLYRNIQYHSHL